MKSYRTYETYYDQRKVSNYFLFLMLQSLLEWHGKLRMHLRSASTYRFRKSLWHWGFITACNKSTRRYKKYKKVQESLLLTAYCLLFFLFSIFNLSTRRYYPNESAGEWLTSYKNLVTYLQETGGPYRTIYVTPDLGRPYVYFLFIINMILKNIFRKLKRRKDRDVFGF